MELLLSYIPTLGRGLIGFFFIFYGISNTLQRHQIIAIMAQKNVPLPRLTFWIGIMLQTIAGVMLMGNLYVKAAAFLLMGFDIVAVFIFHPFWKFEGEIRRLNSIIFVTNLTAVLGALILLLSNIHADLRLRSLFSY